MVMFPKKKLLENSLGIKINTITKKITWHINQVLNTHKILNNYTVTYKANA